MISTKACLETFDRPPLAPAGRAGWIGLDKNEAPFAAFEVVQEALEGLLAEDLRTYPDPYPLYELLGESLELSPNQLLITMGSEQAIRFCFEAMLSEGDEVIFPSPTFAMIDLFAYQCGALPIHVPYGMDLALTGESILNKVTPRTKLIFLANPNNPTGTLFSEGELKHLVSEATRMAVSIIIDEAYYHYTDVTGIGLVRDFNNLVVTRTFSKGWGLAGTRVGYAISQPENIRKLRKLKPIDEISSVSLAICLNALAAQRNGASIVEKNVNQVAKWKERFLRAFPRIVKQTAGNFVLMRIEGNEQKDLLDWFRDQKILVKGPFPEPCMKDCIRFSIGEDPVMEMIFAKVSTLGL